jgi:hypothetical protein
MSTGTSFGFSQPSYSMGGFGGYGGGMSNMGYNPYGSSGYGMTNPYAQMGFGGSSFGGYGGYSDPYASMYGNPFGNQFSNPYGSQFGSSFSSPFGSGYGTSFGGMGMGGYNPYGGFGQVGLGYLPPQQPTINDMVANQFMQQYYGGAFGLGGQPQQPQMRQRPRNPFRGLRAANPSQPTQDALPSQSFEQTAVSAPSNLFITPFQPGTSGPEPLPNYSFAPLDMQFLNDLSYLRF